jgi:purine-nucleoside phosphorylase
MAAAPESLRRIAAFAPQAAVVYGSGLSSFPDGAHVEAELPYAELGWPCTSVPGHANVLRLVSVATGSAPVVRLALACGRPHRYEGFGDAELETPVRGLATAGVRRLVLTNSCGALRPGAAVGRVVVCTDVVDLQAPPRGTDPELLPVCDRAAARRVAAALGAAAAGTGAYVAVLGPQFETPAEVAWLSLRGAVVGMSAAAEVRAARTAGVECCLLALVANVAAAVSSHEEVLAAGGRLSRLLAAGVVSVLRARWTGPDRSGAEGEGRWISPTT